MTENTPNNAPTGHTHDIAQSGGTAGTTQSGYNYQWNNGYCPYCAPKCPSCGRPYGYAPFYPYGYNGSVINLC